MISALPLLGRNSDVMPRVPWHQFQDRQPRAHLVVGAISPEDGALGSDDSKEAQVLLNRLVVKQSPSGDYAATLVRENGSPEVHFAFDNEADALKFAAAVKAEAIGAYAGWASQRAFDLPSTKLAALESSLPAPRDNPRQREADGPRLSRRVRRGPRAPTKRYDD